MTEGQLDPSMKSHQNFTAPAVKIDEWFSINKAGFYYSKTGSLVILKLFLLIKLLHFKGINSTSEEYVNNDVHST